MTSKSFGSKKTLRLGFEEKLAARLGRVYRNFKSPTWRSGGFEMSSVHAGP